MLAATAAAADAGATVIANGIDLPGHPSIVRRPARELAPDSDLGPRRVTVDVGRLDEREVAAALEGGVGLARQALDKELIAAAFLCCQDKVRCVDGSDGRFRPVLSGAGYRDGL